MNLSRFVSPLALALLALALGGCPLAYLDLYEPGEGVGAVAGTGGTGGVGGGGSTGGAGGGCAPGSVMPCYDGPAGTEGHGLCQPGSKICNNDGTGFGPCEGMILPVVENCATPVDEDCDGLAPPCKGTPLWSVRAGDASDQHALAMAVDGMGNVLLTGYYSGALDFGGCPLPTLSASGLGLFVAKLDPSGVCLWSRGASSTGSQIGYRLAVDGAGSILMIGGFSGTLNFGGSCAPLSSTASVDLFVAKLDPSTGACVWAKGAGDAGNQYGFDLAVDAAGNALVTGYFDGTMDLGGCKVTSKGGSDVFVAKLDPLGACKWTVRAGDGGSQDGQGLAVDSDGNVVVTGYFNGTMDFGGMCQSLSTGGSGVFVTKLDPLGACVWSKSGGDVGTQHGQSIAADSANNLLVTGYFTGEMDLGGCKLPSMASPGLFVAKLSPSGTCLWSKGAGDVGKQFGYDVAVDSADNVLVTGSFDGSLNFGGGSFTGVNDFFLVKLDAAGGYLWSHYAGGPSNDDGKSVAVDPANNVLVTGSFNGAADFGTGPLVSKGAADIFVAKYSP